MKMAILELEYKNIRKITALKLPLYQSRWLRNQQQFYYDGQRYR